MIEIKIDGKAIETERGATILQAALRNGIYIPNLCYDKRLRPYGGCRLCMVEIEGQRKIFASCNTPVKEGMVVHTETPQIAKIRKTVLELLLIHHPLDCPVCDKAGECTLQDLAFKYGPNQSRFQGERKSGPERIDSPIVERNPNRCILCGKCVRICYEHQGVGAINIIGRGFKSTISPAFEETLDCEFCGQCIDVCPVGALGSKPYRFRSRVWYMDEHEIVCPYCSCGCTLNLSLREGKITRSRGKQGVGISKGDLCSRGRFGFDYIYSENRLTTPMMKKEGSLTPVSWEEAMEYVAKKLEQIKGQHGPSAIGAIGSQRCTMEDNYMLQKFMRDVVGTDHIDSAARFGYAKAQKAYEKAFGLDSLPVEWESPLQANFILVVDSDVTSSLPVWGLNFIEAKNKGATLVVADAKETKLARNSSQWLRTKPASGIALLNGMMKVIVDEGLYNKESAPKVPFFDALVASLKEFSLDMAARITSLSEEKIIALARAYAAAGKRIIVMTSGSSENTKSLNTILSAANLVLLMGDAPQTLQVPTEFSNTLGMWTVGVRPLSDGINAYDMLYKPGAVKALYIMGENPLVSFQDLNKVEETLKQLDFLVVQDIFLTETAKAADVVLPACSWAEKEGTFMNATGSIQKIPKLISEAGQSIPDWKIFRNLARLMNKDLGLKSLVDIRASIADIVTTCGKDEFRPSFTPVSYELIETVSDEYPLYLVTANILQHSGALSVLSRNLDSVVADAFLQINTKDAAKYNVTDQNFVKITSRRGSLFLKAMLSDEVPEGTVFAPVHFAHAKVNALTYPALNGGLPLVTVRIEAA
jgi:NADH-quinone oxidoreductase subunit G